MIEYIPMNIQHVPQIAELEKLCFSAPWSEASIARELENPLSLWIVAVDGANVAGYIGSQAVLDEADVMNLAVAPQYRRNGVATSLVDALVAALRNKGVTSLALEVRASNEPAKVLYGMLDFVQVGRRPNYYRNPKEDALILRKEWSL